MNWTNNSWNGLIFNGTFSNDTDDYFGEFSSTDIISPFPSSVPTAPTVAPTEYVEYFCEISSKFESTTWFWVAILILPMFGLFYFIYNRLGLPIGSNKCVKFSLIQSTFTYSGVIAMIIVDYSTSVKYDYCINPLSGDDLQFMDFGFDIEIVGFFWFISNCVSLFYFIRIYLFNLSKQVDQHVYGVKEKCYKKYFTKFLTIIVSFGLGALYKPFQKRGSYYNPDTLESESNCSCVDEYIFEISNLSFWLIVSPWILQIGQYCLNQYEKKSKINKENDSGTIECLVGSILYAFAVWTIISAPVIIIYLRLSSLLTSIFGVITYLIDQSGDNSDAFDSVGDALLSLLKVEYLVFFIAILHFSLMACCVKQCFAKKETSNVNNDEMELAVNTVNFKQGTNAQMNDNTQNHHATVQMVS